MYFSRFIQLCFLLAAWNIQILNLILSCSRWTQDLRRMELMQHLLQLWPMPLLLLPTQKSR